MRPGRPGGKRWRSRSSSWPRRPAWTCPGAREDRWRGVLTLRWVLTHMVEEYARHIGHADLIRERIDGAVGQ